MMLSQDSAAQRIGRTGSAAVYFASHRTLRSGSLCAFFKRQIDAASMQSEEQFIRRPEHLVPT